MVAGFKWEICGEILESRPGRRARYVSGGVWMFAVLPPFPVSLRAGAETRRANGGNESRGSQFSAAPGGPVAATRLAPAVKINTILVVLYKGFLEAIYVLFDV